MELIIDGVSKRYKGGIWGLREFSLALQPGVLALLGPNGAGKSTLMRILATITRPTEGSVTWEGADGRPPSDLVRRPNAVRAVLGYLPQDFGVYPNLNPVEFLEYVAALKGLSGRAARQRIPALLQQLNLFDLRRRPLGGFSGGMKQRVGIAQALLNDPRLLIVDEPTTGLDPEERVRFRNLLVDLAEERVVILSTHIVSDAEAVATRIAVIHEGRLLAADSPEALLRRIAGKVWQWTCPSDELLRVRQAHLVSGTARRADGVRVRAVAETRPDPAAVPDTPTLEDAYLGVGP
jgi:ABC-type multidrug transport system ATPase subunit